MDLSKLTKKTLQVSRGFTYTYYTSPARDSKQTVILFHGWPDSASLWAGLINDYLVPNGYGVVALDCLGYGGTSKPTEPGSYAWHHLAADAVEILDSEKLNSVISLGHDCGSAMCQRLYNFYPSRICGVVMVNVAYIPPTGQFDLDMANSIAKEAFGSSSYEYWHFFTADDGADIMNQSLESVYSVAFTEPQTWLENWCTPGGMRKFVSERRTLPTMPYATPEHRADFMERFGKDGGFKAPSCWYKAWTLGVQNEAENLVAEDAKTIDVPVLFWGGEQDVVCKPALLQPSVDAGLLPNCKSVIREGGHWALLENPVEFGQDVLGWVQATLG
ncbi:Alpha/Beta hydrolase protein [Ilyonectria robusta]|uniref:Alpha/Beta hydrolase protein n=1 Tax=Ilyonectria robusta TaxID=1079257 RepID=UPI001E8EA412|nr:Alpha/Beta hydrolase protein [Ilyonectria robusta]KAH8665435.1 Alpha/Beta hydrolase protein [Ilyonectria robusta]